MRKLLVGACMAAVLALSASAQAVTTTSSYSITVTVTPAITSVNLSNTTVNTTGTANAGTVVGAVSVTTNPPGGTYAGVITLGGANASSFALTNGGVLPCNLVVGAANLAAGTYAVTLSATQ